MSLQNLFLGLVIGGFSLFGVVLFTVSLWSASPKTSNRLPAGE
jgi:hypothetical protein